MINPPSHSSPFSCKLLSGETISGQLEKIDADSQSVHYKDASSATIEELGFQQISHLYHHQPLPERTPFPFLLNFSDNRTLNSTAEYHQQDRAGHHLYNVGAHATGIHLFLPVQSPHQLTVDHSPPTEEATRRVDGERVVTLVETMIREAIEQRASDIHLQPSRSTVEINYRIDGFIQLAHQIDPRHYPAVVSRIKILGNMDIAEHRLPQDGAHHLSIEGRKVDLRISTIPVLEGENVVIRILDPKRGLRTLSRIGFREADELGFRKMLKQRSGLILVTGPTGSGKSTTLYAAMHALRNSGLNIISIEDPVEYRIENVRQIEINERAGNTFAKNLRHVLRHDPDVILIGEIRDQETAQIALQSAYTGHLVLSTLHTGDAASAVTRLLEMGMEPYMLKDTLLGIISQRLVRKICRWCNGIPIKMGHCHHCNQSGFHGRIPIYELLRIGATTRELIASGVTAREIRNHAIKDGMIPMSDHAQSLIEQQITTPQELQNHDPS